MYSIQKYVEYLNWSIYSIDVFILYSIEEINLYLSSNSLHIFVIMF